MMMMMMMMMIRCNMSIVHEVTTRTPLGLELLARL